MAESNEEKAFDDILLSYRDRIEDDSLDLTKQNSRIISPREIQRNVTSEGRVYFFRYLNPIGRTTLPYYHLFPCVYTLGIEGRYVTGLNLFYLPHRVREIVLKRLKTRVEGKQSFGRSLMDYEMIKRFPRFEALLKPAIKRYRMDRMGILALEVSNELWDEFFIGDLSDSLQKAFLRKSFINVQLLSRAKIIRNLLNTGEE
jgi:hypothetical protein|tara:strand:- start:79 stop:681 length:603 start_codon:yes stop_codon:yes gene_type:complete